MSRTQVFSIRRSLIRGVYIISGGRVMNRRRRFSSSLSLVVSLVALACAAADARAGLVTWEFAGTITNVDDPTNLLGGLVGVGSAFAGSYTFDPETPDSATGSPNVGSYFAITDIVGDVGSLPFVGPILNSNNIGVRNGIPGVPGDGYSVSVAAILAARDVNFSLSFTDEDGSVFSDDSLPTVPPPLELFEVTRLEIDDLAKGFYVEGDITSLVPEPSTLLLLTVVLTSMTKRSARRRNRVVKT